MVDASSSAKERSSFSIVVSTTLEAFHVLELLKTAQSAGKRVSVLFGIPLPPSRVSDLIRLSEHLGPGSVAVMIDNPAQLDAIKNAAKTISGSFRPGVFVKIDTGYGRAGVPESASSASLNEIPKRIRDLQADGLVSMLGFYSHGGHSYAVDNASSAFAILAREIEGVSAVLAVADSVGLKAGTDQGFILSVGATPTCKSAWIASTGLDEWRESKAWQLLNDAKTQGNTIELHAGNYPCLDMQQMATNSGLSATANIESMSEDSVAPAGLEDISYSVLAEVSSLYEERDTKEIMITAGCLALGREPCKNYPGWGVVSDWPRSKGSARGSGWYVHSISQEHGKMKAGTVPGVSVDNSQVARQWNVGDRLRIWPNHACISSANFPVYFVVDSEDETNGEVVSEVWRRCRGW